MRLRAIIGVSNALVAGLATLLIVSCKTGGSSGVKDAAADSSSPTTATSTATMPPLSPELGEATFVDSDGNDENFWIAKLVAQSDKTVAGLKDTTGLARRSAHSKAHGCVLGTFTINPDRPDNTKIGLFADEGTFPVWIRYSNAFAKVQSDLLPDGRGMAMKVIIDHGSLVGAPKLLPGHETSNAIDFPLVSGPIFPTANVQEYFALQSGGLLKLPPAASARIIARAAEVAAHIARGPLYYSYWSMGAFKFGSNAVKFKLTPCQTPTPNLPLPPTSTYMRDNLISELADGKPDACFVFGVQFQKDQQMMPVEDPSVEWRESDTLFSKATRLVTGNDPASPFIPIATIKIPAQTFTVQDQTTFSPQDDFCERLSFNPWRTVVDQHPLGNLMRARLKVYAASVSKRMEINGATLVSDDVNGTPDDVTKSQNK